MVARKRVTIQICFNIALINPNIYSDFCQGNSVVDPFRKINCVEILCPFGIWNLE